MESPMYIYEYIQSGAPNFSKSKDNFRVPGGLSPKFCIASMGHLRIRGGLSPPSPPEFGAYVYSTLTKYSATTETSIQIV